MSVTYLTTPIVEVRNDPPPRGSGLTRDGYTKRSGAPTARMIRLQGEKRWRRLMVWQFSNLGTLFVRIDGKPHVVREEMLPQEGAVSSRGHATKKTPARLQREIDEALASKAVGSKHTVHATRKKRVAESQEMKDLREAKERLFSALGYAGNGPDQVREYHRRIAEIDAKMKALVK